MDFELLTNGFWIVGKWFKEGMQINQYTANLRELYQTELVGYLVI